MLSIILFFHLEREELMLSNNKGFTLIEVLIAFSIIVLLVTTFLPIGLLIKKESIVLSERRKVSSMLHDELQHYLFEDAIESSVSYFKKNINRQVEFRFIREAELIKGCAIWESIKEKEERFCLYGYP